MLKPISRVGPQAHFPPGGANNPPSGRFACPRAKILPAAWLD